MEGEQYELQTENALVALKIPRYYFLNIKQQNINTQLKKTVII